MARVDVISSAPSLVSIGGLSLVPENGIPVSEIAAFPDLLALIQQFQAATSEADDANSISVGLTDLLPKAGFAVSAPAVRSNTGSVPSAGDLRAVVFRKVPGPAIVSDNPASLVSAPVAGQLGQTLLAASDQEPHSVHLADTAGLLERLVRLVASLVPEIPGSSHEANTPLTPPAENISCLAPHRESMQISVDPLESTGDEHDSQGDTDSDEKVSEPPTTEAALAIVQQWLAQLLKPHDQQAPGTDLHTTKRPFAETKIHGTAPQMSGDQKSTPLVAKSQVTTATTAVGTLRTIAAVVPQRGLTLDPTGLRKALPTSAEISQLASETQGAVAKSGAAVEGSRSLKSPVSELSQHLQALKPISRATRDVQPLAVDHGAAHTRIPTNAAVPVESSSSPKWSTGTPQSLPVVVSSPATAVVQSDSTSIASKASLETKPHGLLQFLTDQIRELYSDSRAAEKKTLHIPRDLPPPQPGERSTAVHLAGIGMLPNHTPKQTEVSSTDFPHHGLDKSPSSDRINPTPHEFWRTNGPVLTQALLREQPGSQSFSVEISPPELGPVRIEVQRHSGQLFANLEARDQSTQQLLQETLPLLQQTLEQSGVKVERLEVHATDSPWNSNSGGSSFGGGGAFSQQSHYPSPREATSQPTRRSRVLGTKDSESAPATVATRRSRIWGRDEIDLHV